MTSAGGDPAELRALARGGAPQSFVLDHRARVLAAAQARHGWRNRRSRTDASATVHSVQRLGREAATLDAWVLHVASCLDDADADPLRQQLLTLGAGHRLLAGLPPRGRLDLVSLPLDLLTDAELDLAAAWRRTPVSWRDRLHRERARRWLRRLPDRLDAVPGDDLGGIGGWLARQLDRLLVDRVSLLTDLHVTQQEHRELLVAQATGLELLLARPDLTVLSFDPASPTPAAGPAVRIALGDVQRADHLAVLLPGTSIGLHTAGVALRDARALDEAVHGMAPSGPGAHATILDLYDAPLDLGRAADPAAGAAAGAATGAFLDDLLATLSTAPRTTLVGHSYGAFTAARAATHAPHHTDALVLLGAPGVGVAHVGELDLDRTAVWAAQAPGDPIIGVADLDELVAALPASLRRRLGPLTQPDAAFGPDPVDPEFGARVLPTSATPGAPGDAIRGHTTYLAAGSASVAAVAAVVVGRDPRVRPARPPRRDRPASAATD